MRTEFSYLHEKIKEYPERFIISPTSIVTIEEFEKIHPDVPNDYTDFLRQFGAMTICEGAFCVYGGAIGVQEIFDVDDQELEGILLIGDNCAGDFLGYDTLNSWQLVEGSLETYEFSQAVEFESGELLPVRHFEVFIQNLVRMIFPQA